MYIFAVFFIRARTQNLVICNPMEISQNTLMRPINRGIRAAFKRLLTGTSRAWLKPRLQIRPISLYFLFYFILHFVTLLYIQKIMTMFKFFIHSFFLSRFHYPLTPFYPQDFKIQDFQDLFFPFNTNSSLVYDFILSHPLPSTTMTRTIKITTGTIYFEWRFFLVNRGRLHGSPFNIDYYAWPQFQIQVLNKRVYGVVCKWRVWEG